MGIVTGRAAALGDGGMSGRGIGHLGAHSGMAFDAQGTALFRQHSNTAAAVRVMALGAALCDHGVDVFHLFQGLLIRVTVIAQLVACRRQLVLRRAAVHIVAGAAIFSDRRVDMGGFLLAAVAQVA